MSPADRPPAVRRWLRRPLWWALAGLLLALALVAADRAAVRDDRREFSDGPRVTAWPDPRWDGGADLQLTYEHPSGETVDADTYVWTPHLLPSRGEPVEVVVSNDDPTAVRLVGDRYRPSSPWQYVLFAAPFLVLWAVRRWSIARAARIAETAPTTYQMRGIPSCPGWWSWRWRMHLYALDVEPGGVPVCTVPLIAAPAALGERTVEAKGAPRPWGRVVLRDQGIGEVLWPAGRCLRIHGWSRRSLEPGRAGRPTPVGPWLIALIIATSLAGLVVDELSDDEFTDVEDRAQQIEAEVIGQVRDEGQLVTEVRAPWLGERLTSTVVADEELEPGDQLRVLIDPERPSRVWAPGEDAPGHNLAGLFYLLALVFGLVFVVIRVRERRAHRRLVFVLPPPQHGPVLRPDWPRLGGGPPPPPPPGPPTWPPQTDAEG